MKRAIAIAVFLAVASVAIYLMVLSYGDRREGVGFDKGAMGIIEQLVAGNNIKYTAQDGSEFFIDLVADEPQYKSKGTICMSCHRYDTYSSMKGGEHK